jgi:hypothetical protein
LAKTRLTRKRRQSPSLHRQQALLICLTSQSLQITHALTVAQVSLHAPGRSQAASNIDTASSGGKTFTVNASDQVGNTPAPQSASYTVGYGVVALYDQTKVHKSGSTVPIKIQVVDANGVNYSSASLPVQAMSVVLVSANSSGTPEDAGNSNPDLNFRFDASLGGYIFNLKDDRICGRYL